MFQYSLTGKDGSGSGFGSWKTVPAVPVLLLVSGNTRFRRFRFLVPVRFLSHPAFKTSTKITSRGFFFCFEVIFGLARFFLKEYHSPRKHYLPEKNIFELFSDYRFTISISLT